MTGSAYIASLKLIRAQLQFRCLQRSKGCQDDAAAAGDQLPHADLPRVW